MARVTGRYVRQQSGPEGYSAFIPDPLPPHPPIEYTDGLIHAFDRAAVAAGRLDAASMDIPDAKLFLYTYIRKEAVLSSQIEGTQSTLSDLLLYENKAALGVPVDDVTEVSNYVAALEHGLQRLRGGFPLSLRLIAEMHGVLMRRGRGEHATPGEFRRSQNWIGGRKPGDAHFVPPPAHEVMPALSALEKFIHADGGIPPLIKAGLAHVQFETIHPFLDGNGRIGRLLIALMLSESGVLQHPLLYLSLYFKRYRQEYYTALGNVRTAGDWEGWIEYYLRGVAAVATDAMQRARRLRSIFEHDRSEIMAHGSRFGTTIRIHEALKQRALLSVPSACAMTGLTPPPVRKAFTLLQQLGIVDEVTGGQRDRVYRYRKYVELLNEEAAI